MSVFLSYSRADTNFVDLIYRLLESKGYDTWIDRRNIDAGSRWDQSIQNAIDAKSHMMVVLSPDSAGSENVADEWSYAIEQGKTVIPLYYLECSVPMRLRRLQYINFIEQPFALAFEQLVETLGAPDTRPQDRIELAKREGLIFIEIPQVDIRIAFVYSDYPAAASFIRTVWFCLLWSVIPRGSSQDMFYEYGVRWSLRNKATDEVFALPEERKNLLFHEMGIEPGMDLELVLL